MSDIDWTASTLASPVGRRNPGPVDPRRALLILPHSSEDAHIATMPLDLDPTSPLLARLAAERQRRWNAELRAYIGQWNGDRTDENLFKLRVWLDDNPAPKAAADDIAALRQHEELLDQVAGILHVAGVLTARQKMLDQGIPDKRRVYLSPNRVRATNPDLPPVPKAKPLLDGDGRSRKLSRTDKFRLEQEQALAAKHAEQAARAQALGLPPPTFETFILIGRVLKFDPRSMEGIAGVTLPGTGYMEVPFPSSATIRAGLTTLTPHQQELQMTIKRRIGDGALLVEKIELSAGSRAAKLAELEQQAEAAERNYQIFGRVPRI
jgi:hypothetical protein